MGLACKSRWLHAYMDSWKQRTFINALGDLRISTKSTSNYQFLCSHFFCCPSPMIPHLARRHWSLALALLSSLLPCSRYRPITVDIDGLMVWTDESTLAIFIAISRSLHCYSLATTGSRCGLCSCFGHQKHRLLSSVLYCSSLCCVSQVLAQSDCHYLPCYPSIEPFIGSYVMSSEKWKDWSVYMCNHPAANVRGCEGDPCRWTRVLEFQTNWFNQQVPCEPQKVAKLVHVHATKFHWQCEGLQRWTWSRRAMDYHPVWYSHCWRPVPAYIYLQKWKVVQLVHVHGRWFYRQHKGIEGWPWCWRPFHFEEDLTTAHN